MKIIFSFFILIITVTFSYSQKIVIIDSLDNTLVPYCAIKYNNYKGFYGDETGKVDLNNIVFDTLEIHNINYKTKKIPFGNISDTIRLVKNLFTLDDVVLSSNNFNKINTLGLKKTKFCGSWPLFNHHKIITSFTPKIRFNTLLLEKIKINFKDNLSLDKIDLQFFIGLNNDKNSELELVFLSDIIKSENLIKPNVISYDFNDKIELPNQGFIIGLYYTARNNEKIEIRPLLSSSKNKYFETETYIRYSFENNFDHFLINSCHKGEVDYSLLVELEVSYE